MRFSIPDEDPLELDVTMSKVANNRTHPTNFIAESKFARKNLKKQLCTKIF